MSASVWDPAGQEIPVINGASTLFPQVFTATAGQTHFVITNFKFVPNTGSLLLFVMGVFQVITKNFTEGSDGMSFDMTTTELQAGDEVVALGFIGITAAITNTAANISYATTTLADILLNHTDLVVTSYTGLRAVQHIYFSFAYLTGAVTSGDGSSGYYWYDPTDTTSADNGSSIIVATDGGRWKLLLNSAITAPIGDNSNNAATTKFVQQSHVSALAHLIHPSTDGKWRDLYRSGLRPGFHQQQWGGGIVGYELLDSATDTVIPFDSATGFIEDTASLLFIGSVSTALYISQGFKTGENLSIQAMWVKLYKTVNPADNVKLLICLDDGTGKPSGFTGITNGVANLINGKQIGSKTDGYWYRFVFATPPVVTAGVQYHTVVTRTGAVDATNFCIWKAGGTGKYPFGQTCTSDGTTWTAFANSKCNFILEPVTTNQMLKSGGIFGNDTITFNQGNTIMQSKVLVDRMANYATGKIFTQLLRVTNPIAGTTLLDMCLGINHDRLVLTCDAGTGYFRVTLYDAAKTATSLVATQAINTPTFVDLAVVLRCMNDGADYLQLWINGVMLVQTAGVSYNLSPLWRDLGTRWIGGGFPISPVWTQDLNFATLPSAQGWTWTGTGTEVNCMSVANGKLYQNKNGYAATDTGYYVKPTAGFNNSVGWAVELSTRDLNSSYLNTISPINIIVQDGTKQVSINIQEFFITSGSIATVDFFAQLDFKTTDTDILITGKGSDYYVFANGKLLIDGTGKLLVTSAVNSVTFGDTDATSTNNADVIWSGLKYYIGGQVLPSISTGMILHESAYLVGNQTVSLAAIYNSGNPISAKNYWNQSKNYVQDIPWVIQMLGVTISPVTAGTVAGTKITDMEAFVLGDKFNIQGSSTLTNNTAANNITIGLLLDGSVDSKLERIYTEPVIGYAINLQVQVNLVTYTGMHKFELYNYAAAGTTTAFLQERIFNIASPISLY